MTTDRPSLADQLNGNGASRNANRSRRLATTPFMRSSVSPFRGPSSGTHPEVPMSAFEVMRRASLGVFGAVALACAGAPGGAFALTRAVGGIHVDVAPSRENAGDPTAAWVAQVPARLRTRWSGW
jgi:hypothetical protein